MSLKYFVAAGQREHTIQFWFCLVIVGFPNLCHQTPITRLLY